jgi:aryl-alcohol dehydrogenase-like predicted oxidoreductase
MRYVSLAGGGPNVSVLGLGCAAMMGSAGRRESVTALNAAYDAGITFFDTARSYGYGACEGLLGEFCAGRRERVTLCTKFGILPARNNWKQTMKPLARGAVKLVPGLRKVARKQAGRLQSKNQFSAGVLRRSLEKSLRELRTDYVDILLMHAAPLSVLAQEELLLELERVVAEGKVRAAGISGEAEVIAAALASGAGVLRSAQFACDIGNFGFLESIAGLTPPDAGSGQARMFLVGNHPFGGAAGMGQTLRGIAALADDPALPQELRAKLDLKDPQLLPEVILNAVLAGTGIDAVVPAMMQPRHLQSNCRALEDCRFSHAELVELRRELASVADGLRETA